MFLKNKEIAKPDSQDKMRLTVVLTSLRQNYLSCSMVKSLSLKASFKATPVVFSTCPS